MTTRRFNAPPIDTSTELRGDGRRITYDFAQIELRVCAQLAALVGTTWRRDGETRRVVKITDTAEVIYVAEAGTRSALRQRCTVEAWQRWQERARAE